MKKIYDSDITKILSVPSSTLKDWKKSDATNWRFKVYSFLKQQSKKDLEDFVINLVSSKNIFGQNSNALKDSDENISSSRSQ